MAGEPWTQSDVEILAHEYFEVLNAELAGRDVVKADALRRAQSLMPTDRTIHTLKDRCYRISEELWKRDLPWVEGWKPPQLVGQSPNSVNVAATIWSAIEPLVTQSDTSADRSDETPEQMSQAYMTDLERRKAVEDLAQERLMQHFERRGWTVEDTHLTSPFDARAVKGDQVQYLEAKGSTSGGIAVFVTHGEVDWALTHPNQCVMGILSGIQFDASGRIDRSSGDLKLFDWAPESGHLQPIQYQWTPPRP